LFRQEYLGGLCRNLFDPGDVLKSSGTKGESMLRLLAVAASASIALVMPGLAGGETVSSPRKPLRFVLDKPLEEGGKTRVRLRNRSDVTYIYNPYYEACDMVYRELPSRRKFLIPEGTHCDLVGKEELSPGETATLFRWDLDECIEDNWGCTKARDLPVGRYLMKGWFRPKDGGDWTRVRLAFRIR
jgi:hypothetical protein